MRSKLNLLIVLAVLVLLAINASDGFAIGGNVGTRSAQFLKIGAGARAVGMGSAFVGLANDATAIYWNPAGLAYIDKTQFSFMHLWWFQDIAYEYFAHAQPTKYGTIGWSLAYLHMDPLQGRDVEGEPTSDFRASDMAITLGYGNRIAKDIFIGGSIKYINEKIEDEMASTFAFDLGFLHRTQFKNLFLGGSFQNWGGTLKFAEEPDKLPSNAKLGLCYTVSLARNPLNLAVDFVIPSDAKTGLHLGAEYIYNHMIMGRLGYRTETDLGFLSGISFGVGFLYARTESYRIDYAFVPQGVLGNTHTISLTVTF
ncbi:MAG TPA: PorV/PorQ family protein [candidate division Zixibacteria bacterium]